MLRRSTKIQLVIFLIITLVGVSYVSATYVGLAKNVFSSGGCSFYAEFPDSGGIFTNAEVTYRGVQVGHVGTLTLIPNGVRVKLNVDNCSGDKIPVNGTYAQVSNRSVIGEQYVNIIPKNNDAPYFRGNETIPMADNKLPIPVQVLLTNLDRLVNSVSTADLRTTVTELGTAFNDQGPNLRQLLLSTSNLLQAATTNLPDTLDLIKISDQTLNTQIAAAPDLQSWAHSLNLLSAQLKQSDSDIRSLLDNGPGDLGVLSAFITDNQTDLGIIFNNLASTGQLLVRHRSGVEELFELYPALLAGSYTVLHPDGVGHLGFVLNQPDPRDCGSTQANREPREGYEGTVVRDPRNTAPIAPNVAAHCGLSPSTGINIRGAQNAPGGDPISTAGAGLVYPRVITGDTINVATTDGSQNVLGDKAWVSMLTFGLE
jgi:phospholipid/cholesterol/gamma-HCH transport system substrate-binding protein